MNPLLILITLVALINGGYYGWKFFQENSWNSLLQNIALWYDGLWKDASVLWFLLIVFLVVVVPKVIISTIRDNRWYKSLPTSSEYSNKYLKDNKGSGFQCRKCGSKSIRNWGRAGAQDAERIFICNHCGSHLYRN